MNFGLTEEQELLHSEARKFLEEQSPLDEVRRTTSNPEGYCPKQWKTIAELGWTGLVIGEKYGGAGLGWIDLIVVLEETGRALFPSPLISTLIAGSTIADFASDAQKERWLPGLASGDEIGALALLDDASAPALGAAKPRATRDGDAFRVSGTRLHVIDAPNATSILIAFTDDTDALHLAYVPAATAGITVEPRETVDRTRRIGHVTLANLRVAPEDVLASGDDAQRVLESTLDRGAVATTAEILGAGTAIHAMTVQYAKDRVQFGSAIGRYQGVKHPLAEMYVDLESIRSLLYYAAWAIEEKPEDAPLAASRAKAFATEAFTDIGVGAIQLHGAVGYTEEYDVQLYLKRSKWARPAFGDEIHHLERVARLGGL
ncbi:MAG: acyl-CoA dehydrogenase family protein [Myxococcota bacterium]|jgi:alkylation response protein AidB-like acyl-CoA dehydrogenase|nr:acyl-CoA dehydrogenase family protein [Myxococcota bacterium]